MVSVCFMKERKKEESKAARIFVLLWWICLLVPGAAVHMNGCLTRYCFSPLSDALCSVASRVGNCLLNARPSPPDKRLLDAQSLRREIARPCNAKTS